MSKPPESLTYPRDVLQEAFALGEKAFDFDSRQNVRYVALDQEQVVKMENTLESVPTSQTMDLSLKDETKNTTLFPEGSFMGISGRMMTWNAHLNVRK